VKETPIVYELANFEILLITYKFVTDESTLHFFSLLLILLALSTRGKHFFNIEDEGIEYKILSFINVMHIFMSIVVILELLIDSTDTHAYMVILVPIVMYFALQIFLRKRKIGADLGKIIDNQAGYAEFIQ
jgi:predicted neutral ceramidase superfamily lipid hydrolase